MKDIQKYRAFYLGTFILLFLIEVLIALYVHDDIIRPFGGDVIVVWLIYCFVRIFIPFKFKLLELWVFVFAVFIELMQYINIVDLLGMSDNRLLSTVLGTSFSLIDIGCYALGSAVIVAVKILIKRIGKRNKEKNEKETQ